MALAGRAAMMDGVLAPWGPIVTGAATRYMRP